MAQTQFLAESLGVGQSEALKAPSPHVHFERITKRFGNVLANDSVTASVSAGGIHAFLGENGAGKSTLMKILCGHYQPDGGAIFLNGKQVTLKSPSQARQLGVGMVYQQFTLVPSMTVFENVLLGDSNNPFLLNQKAQAERVEAKAKEFGMELDVLAPIWRLSIAERQKVEILKLLWRDSKILILDEPTSQLAPFEAEEILLTMDKLARQGRIVVLISHHIEEILRFSSHLTVLRKGKSVANLESHTVSGQELARLMVDTLIGSTISRVGTQSTSPCLSIKDVSVKSSQTNRSLNSVGFDLYAGEILGVAGVIGSGQDEIASILTGHLKPDSGTLLIDGREANWRDLSHPRKSAAYVPADPRKSSVGDLTLEHNSMLRDVHRKEFLRGLFLRSQVIQNIAKVRIAEFDVRPNDPHVLCGSLSGGNLQRLVLSRELDNPSAILVAVNPAAGLDLAMAQRVSQEIRNAASKGKAVVLISPDLQELLAICDRIMVVCSGSIVGTERAENLDGESLGLLLGGVKLDVVRNLAKFLDPAVNAQIDAETKATLCELLGSDSAWQKKLAAQIALRVFDRADLPEIEHRLKLEMNPECRTWLQIIQAKLGGVLHIKVMEFAFRTNPRSFVEATRRIYKCDDLKSLKAVVLNRLQSRSSIWEDILAKLVLDYLKRSSA